MFFAENNMYTERVKQWREVKYFREENQEVLREGCKACVTHLTCVMWTRQGLTHKHRCVCYAHRVVQMWHTRSAFWRYYVTLFLKCTLPAGHHGHLLTANFDSEVKCCKFWMNQHRGLQKELQLFDDELTSKAEAFRDDWGIFWSVEIIWVAVRQRKLSIHSGVD